MEDINNLNLYCLFQLYLQKLNIFCPFQLIIVHLEVKRVIKSLLCLQGWGISGLLALRMCNLYLPCLMAREISMLPILGPINQISPSLLYNNLQ